MKHSPAFNKLCEDARGKVREISVGQVHERLEGGDTLFVGLFHFLDLAADGRQFRIRRRLDGRGNGEGQSHRR